MHANLSIHCIVSGFFVLVATFYVVCAQNGLSSYGVPEEPLITSDTEQQRQAEDHGGGHGGGHHHHSDNPLDWLRASVPGYFSLSYNILTQFHSIIQHTKSKKYCSYNFCFRGARC